MTFKSTFWLNYLRPNIFVRNISEINLPLLKINGIKLIICDLDNTLVPHFSNYPNKFVYDFIRKVKNEGIKIVIASNNTKKRVSRFVKKLSETIEIDGFLWNCKKPFKWKVRKFLLENDFHPSNTVVIGDQFLTDILLANRFKMKSILVLPMIDQNRNESINWLQKFLEKFIYKKLQLENMWISEGESNEQFSNEEWELL